MKLQILAVFAGIFSIQSQATAVPGISLGPAGKVHRFIQEIKGSEIASSNPKLKNKAIRFKEVEINAYLIDLVKERGRGQITTAAVQLLGDKQLKIHLEAQVNWKEILGEDSVTSSLLQKIGKAGTSIEASLRTASAKGKGYVHVLSVTIAGLPLPEGLIARLLQHVGEKQRPPINFSGLISLPYGIQKIDVEKSTLAIYF